MASSANVVFGGSLSFDHRIHEWSIFKCRLFQFYTANDITEQTDKAGVKRRAILLSSLSEDTFRILRDLVTPKELDDTEYKVLIHYLDKHFMPRKCTFAERFKFYKAEQRPGEGLAEWAARVRSLAQYCGFKSELDIALRDRFVLGLENISEKEKLFSECIDTLTFNKALELAQGVHCARSALQSTLETTRDSSPSQRTIFAVRASTSRLGSQQQQQRKMFCEVCGYKNHVKNQCRFINYTCQKCHQIGHLKRMCKTQIKNNNFVTEEGDDIVEGEKFYNIRSVTGEPMQQMVTIAGESILCEIDSGSAVSVMPNDVYEAYFKTKFKMRFSNIVLNCYNGSKIAPKGSVELPLTYEKCTQRITFFVIDTIHKRPTLLGRDFLSLFKLKICGSCYYSANESDLGSKLLKKYEKLFSDELGRFNKFKVTLKIKPNVPLKFFKPRPVPFALKNKVEIEIKRLVELGILEKIDHSDIATPIVPVLRADGNIRICGDYSVTLNKALYVDNYPVPRIEEIFAKLHGGEEFSKLDLSRAYNQLELDESKQLTCINTHKGLYRYNRLVFGLSNAPFIFQQTLEKLLGDIEGVCIFIDDILVTGENRSIHLERLENVLSRLEDAGMRLKKDKCEFFRDSVEYLGFVIDKNGLHKSQKKVDAILNCKRPKNVSELKSFLGLVNYYRCFVPNTSGVLNPLNCLLKKDAKWHWGEEHENSFNAIKQEMASERVLAHYNPELTTIVTADAGPEGLGAVLSQVQGNGEERVIAYASRSLSKAECNYAQIQKEAAALVFAVKKFHYFLYGRMTPFILRTDHKPLITIFGDKKGIPELAANRLQRYALFLSSYNFDIKYIKSDDNIADFLSRSIDGMRQCNEVLSPEVDTCLYINFLTNNILKPVTLNDVKLATAEDAILNRVSQYVNKGWPGKLLNDNFKPYYNCRFELSVENGCLLRGHKLVIPTIFREQLLNELHSSHFGIVKTKAEARSRMWWPNIDKHIEQKIGSCSICSTMRSAPPRSPLSPWPYPENPWERVHLDMFSLEGKHYLIIVDAHTKWIECYSMQSTDTLSIIIKLEDVMSRFGLMKVLVTDNATNFCSNEFNEFCSINGIKHITSPPYHPASNGQAENSVKTIKKGIKIILTEKNNQVSINKKINNLLFSYRNSVHTTTGFSPAQLMFGRSLRCRFDLLRGTKSLESQNSPSTLSFKPNQNVCSKQISQTRNYGGQRNVKLKKGDQVLVKHYFYNGNKHTWKKGIVQEKIGNRIYLVHILDLDLVVEKHIDHLCLYKGSNEFCITKQHNKGGNNVVLSSSFGEAGLKCSGHSVQETDYPNQIATTESEVEGEGIEPSVGPNVSPDSNECSQSENVLDLTSKEPNERRYPVRSTRNPSAKYKY